MNNKPLPTTPEIYWEPWIDAYDGLLSMPDLFDVDAESGEEIPQDIVFQSHVKTVMTPFGLLPLSENALASKHFKFWVAHSNFRITQKYTKIISAVEGVEAINVLTPYRFRIAVGKMFQDRDVMFTVKQVLLLFHNEVAENDNTSI